MSTVISQLAISVDGFIAGPDQSEDDPIGEGGMRLHEWAFSADPGSADAAIKATITEGIGAVVVPIVLAGGERLFEDVGAPDLEIVEAITSPAVTHIRYRIVH